MASGDRIELLTAGTFESAMSTVAKESSVQSCATKIDNVDADIAALVSTINNINSVNTSDYQLDQSMSSTLTDLYNNRIGATNSTGGTATAGTVMAKLNALINSVNNISTGINDSSLNSTVFIPSDTVLKTIVNTPITLTSSNRPILGYFIAKYSGVLRIKINARSTSDSTVCYIYASHNPTSSSPTLYPTMPSGVSVGSSSYERSEQINIKALSNTDYIWDIHVKSGDIIYFFPSVSMSNVTMTCNSLIVCGSTISTY